MLRLSSSVAPSRHHTLGSAPFAARVARVVASGACAALLLSATTLARAQTTAATPSAPATPGSPPAPASASSGAPATGSSDASEVAIEARRQYNLGTQAYAAHRYEEAAKSFDAAAAYKAHGVTLFTAGLAWELSGQPERAADDFARALDVGGLSAEQGNTAKEKLATLERKLGTLAVTAPDGWKVQLDAYGEVGAPAHLHAPAGYHTLLVHAPGKDVERVDVKLDEGKTTAMAFPTTPAVATAPEPAKTSPGPRDHDRDHDSSGESSGVRLRKSIGLVAIGVGAAALGAAAVLGIEANDAKDTFDASPTHATFDHARGLQTWTNVALVAGGVVLVGGVVLFVWPSGGGSGEVRAGVGLGDVRVGGTF